MDSIISTLAFAKTIKHWNNRPLIPFLNIPFANVISMRPEVQYAMKKLNIVERDVLTCFDIFKSPPLSMAKDPIDLILIDHNSFAAFWKKNSLVDKKSLRVLAIFDHHKDENTNLSASPRMIENCGSSATLIVKYFENNSIMIDDDCKFALLTTIIFDTVNLTWRNTDLDDEAIRYLKRSLKQSQNSISVDTKHIFSEIESCFRALPSTNFTISQLLEKDYKLYLHGDGASVVGIKESFYYGISTIHSSFEQMFADASEEEKWARDIEVWMTRERIKFLMITIAWREQNSTFHSQQLAIFKDSSLSQELLENMEKYLNDADLKLETISQKPNRYTLFDQKNISISRKQLAPLCAAFFQSQK